MVEEGEKTGLDASNFPTSEKDPKILSYIEEWLKVSTGETLPTIASNLKSEKDRVIGDKLVEQNKKHNEYMTDPNFKLIKKHKYSNYYSLTQEGKGQPPIIKCTGIVPMSVIDFGLCLQDEELSKIYDPTLETEIVLREIHPEIEVFRTKYKSSWPVKARDFVIAEWTHLTSEGCFYINSVDVDDEVGGELDKGYIRGTFSGGWILKPISEEETEVTYFSELDLAGDLSGIIKNEVAADEGKMIENILKALEKLEKAK